MGQWRAYAVINLQSRTKGMVRTFWGILLTTTCAVGCVSAVDLVDVQASQTQFSMVGCENCTAPQMKALALRSTSPGNYVFVYSLATNAVRKYRVYLDSTCKYDPPSKGAGADEQRTESNPVPLCGAYRDAVESAVDPSVQGIFDSMHQLSINAPQLMATGNANWWVGGNGMRRVGNDSATGLPFNLPDVAWEAPQGAAFRLMDELGDILKDQNRLHDIDPDLATLIYGIYMPSVNVSITISMNPSVTAQGSLLLDNEKAVKLRVCDTDGNCAIVAITRDRTQLNLVFDSVVDKNGNTYPSPQLKKPDTPQWTFPGGYGVKFVDSMTRHGVDISMHGGYYTLSCAWVGSRLIGCVAE